VLSVGIEAAKRSFFDWKLIQRSMMKSADRVASKFGAYVRTRARSSMKRRNGSSRPGQPPHAHGPGLIKRFLFFATSGPGNVVIGPAKLNKPAPRVLAALESGGDSLLIKRVKGRKVEQRIQIAARPFMRPAFEKELPSLSKLWRNALAKSV
jgi:hypothetical protein